MCVCVVFGSKGGKGGGGIKSSSCYCSCFLLACLLLALQPSPPAYLHPLSRFPPAELSPCCHTLPYHTITHPSYLIK